VLEHVNEVWQKTRGTVELSFCNDFSPYSYRTKCYTFSRNPDSTTQRLRYKSQSPKIHYMQSHRPIPDISYPVRLCSHHTYTLTEPPLDPVLLAM
jgi:hypothetical protein